ncbi:hypothetical protein [Nannocystis punicea]|uniref:Protease inhibitor Inh n=1 Tax=Nannocystis punicea TaxID=2995304 RepID=A0ABY7GYW6_9BACT|nr:hypothetical protein [Nannocystis poenicansa]WAS92168.1 hypothetical protein O0S08_38795 [Nannocystis poenicansa]
MRGRIAWLVVGGLAACAGSKDMSQGPGSAERPASTSAASVSPSTPTAEVAAGASEGPAAADAVDPAASAQPEAPAPAPAKVAPARLLGREQKDIEAQLGALRFADGWATPADDALQLQFRGGRCVGLRGHVPEDMDCAAVATWLGFAEATYPLRRSDGCEWPGISLKHRLAEGVAGSYVPATREFTLTVRR